MAALLNHAATQDRLKPLGHSLPTKLRAATRVMRAVESVFERRNLLPRTKLRAGQEDLNGLTEPRQHANDRARSLGIDHSPVDGGCLGKAEHPGQRPDIFELPSDGPEVHSI